MSKQFAIVLSVILMIPIAIFALDKFYYLLGYMPIVLFIVIAAAALWVVIAIISIIAVIFGKLSEE